MNDDFLIIDDEEAVGAQSQPHWKILVVDDEQEVHDITLIALQGFTFGGRTVEFLHAWSGAEACRLMAEHSDVAAILLDVVMETDHAGLDVVRHVRDELKNPFVRIILRTGQPGQAPEHQIITQYDINDYKHKTELTRQKLFTTVHTSLSAYRDLMALDANRRGLRKIIEASTEIFACRSMDQFAQGVLEQLAALLYINNDALVITASGVVVENDCSVDIKVIAGIGKYANLANANPRDVLDKETYSQLQKALNDRESYFGEDHLAAFYETPAGSRDVLYISGAVPLEPPDRELIQLFCRNVAIAQDIIQSLEQAS